MSKAEQGQAKTRSEQNIAKNTQTGADINTGLQDVMGTAKSTAASILPGVVSNYSDIASTGGFDPSILGRVNDTYSKLATTGGFSPEDTTSMYNRASQGARAAYDVGQGQAQRTAAATGGYGDTSAAIVGDLARKGSQASERAITDTTATLAPLKQQGMVAGAQGLSNTQNQVAGNRLQATGGLTNIYGMNESQVNQTVDAIIRNFQTTGQLNAQDEQILVGLANRPGVFDKIVSTIGTLGGAGAGVLSAVKPGGF